MPFIHPKFPTTQTAIIATDAEGTLALAQDVPVVEFERDAVLVETAAVALNPVDTKMMHGFAVPGAILGFDFAGTVVAVGPDVELSLKPGDRICGSADGMSKKRPHGGAFAQYTDCPASLTLKLPAEMPFTDAAGLCTSLMAAGLALFHSLELPVTLDEPAEEPFFVLVNGGASSTGTMALQLLKRCNLRAITTCSPNNFDLVKSYGAEVAFDYNSSTCAQDIRAYTSNNLMYAVDCITHPSSMKLCYAAIGRAGGRYTAADPYPEAGCTRQAITPDWILATAATGRASGWPEPFCRDGDLATRQFADEFFAMAQRAFDEGAIRSHPVRLEKGGLPGVLQGVDIIRRGEVRGQKLVYPVQWTKNHAN